MSLSGKTVVVTRPKGQLDGISDRLRTLGARVSALPALEIAALQDFSELDAALQDLPHYDWVVLTSVNGVRALIDRMRQRDVPLERLAARKLAVIGPATAEALERDVRTPDLVPSEYVAEAIADELGEISGQRFLLARADLARRELALRLRQRGAEVTELDVYRIVPSLDPVALPERAPDYLLLTSSEGAKATVRRLTELDRSHWLETARLICIGPITADTVRALGYEVAATANPYTTEGLVQALLEDARSVAHV